MLRPPPPSSLHIGPLLWIDLMTHILLSLLVLIIIKLILRLILANSRSRPQNDCREEKYEKCVPSAPHEKLLVQSPSSHH